MTLADLRREAASCQNCDLYARATQTVFGEGDAGASLMLVGEQPGDKEDLTGLPFVGPAGQLLDRGLEQAGIDRSSVYVTNVVKHFKWTERGKARIHKKPNAEEIGACRPWLDAELEVVRPRLVVCLGATAAQALLGRSFRVTKQRGQLVDWPERPGAGTEPERPGAETGPERPGAGTGPDPLIMATVHPSSILRAPDAEAREAEFTGFVADLKVAAGVLRSAAA
jgi:DNA polymerase